MHKIKPGFSKNVSERRKFEQDSVNSDGHSTTMKKRDEKSAQKQLLLMMQKLNNNPDSANQNIKNLDMPKLMNTMNNQGDQFSFNTNISAK